MKSAVRRFIYSLIACLCLVTGGAMEAAVTITSGTPPNAAINTPYNFTFTATAPSCSGPPTFAWSATGLPGDGLTLDAETGNLAGTPTATGPVSFTVTATENECEGEVKSQSYTIAVSSPAEVFYVLNPTESAISIVAVNGTASVNCNFDGPCAPYFDTVGGIWDFTADASGNFYVATGNAIVQLTPAGTPTTVVPFTATGEFSEFANFFSVALDAGGNYVVADNGNHAIWIFPAGGGAGTLVGTYAGTCGDGCEDVYVRIDASGNYIVAEDGDGDFGETQIYQFTPCTTSPIVCPAPQAPGGVIDGFINGYVGGLTFDGTGPNANYVITVLSEGDYVAKVTPTGGVSTFYGNTNDTLGEPLGVFRDPQTGNFLIADDDNEEVFTLSADGTGLGYFNTGDSLSNAVAVLKLPPAAAHVVPPTAPIPPLVITGGALPAGFAYEPYSAGVGASGGVPPYSFSATGAPAGITISQIGAISGTTKATGSFSLVVTVTDSVGTQATATYTMTIAATPPITVLSGTLTSTVVQTPVSLTLPASGGAPTYTWTLAVGSPPTGLTLEPTGTLRGHALATGTFNFSARATDTQGASAIGYFSMTILPAPLTLQSSSTLPAGMVTVNYGVATIWGSGGVPPYQFAAPANSLPPGLTLAPDGAITGTPTATGTYSFTVTQSDSATPASTGTGNYSITTRPYTTDLLLSAGSVSFTIAAGTAVLPLAQTVQVQSSDVTQVLGYSVAVSPASATWLSVSSGGTTTPGSFSISLNSAALSLAGATTPYQANVVVTCTSGPCTGRSQTVGVSLAVNTLAPELTVISNILAFNTQAGAPQASTQPLLIQNSGGGTIGFASITCGTPWCQVSGVPGSVGAQATISVKVTADPTGLGAGYYFTDISIISSAGSAIVPVTFLIAANGTITLGPAGAEFTLPQGGTPVGNTSFLVSVSGSAPVSFNAQISPAVPWLSVTPTSGSASGTQPATVNLVFDPTQVAALTPGAYYASVEISSSGAANSPQSFEVVLDVTAPAQPTTPNPVPGGLIFLTESTPPVNAPPSQTVSVFSASPTSTGYQASTATNSGGNWLSVSPATGTTSSTAAAQSSVTVNPSGLKAGVYTGTVSYAFSVTAVRSVNVTLIVQNINATSSSSETSISSAGASKDAHPAAAAACTPSQIVPTSTALVSNFAAAAAWPIEIAINLSDDCGTPIGNGQVVATFSNSDPPLVLAVANASAGDYVATWTPQHATSQIAINALASAAGLPTANLQLAGAVTPNNAPILAESSIANFYNPVGGAPLAPGTLVQITGQYLAGQTLSDPTVPVPTTLGGTSVIIGGIQAPVSYVSPGQINAQVPFELPPGQPYQLFVSANNALTAPQSLSRCGLAGSVGTAYWICPGEPSERRGGDRDSTGGTG